MAATSMDELDGAGPSASEERNSARLQERFLQLCLKKQASRSCEQPANSKAKTTSVKKLSSALVTNVSKMDSYVETAPEKMSLSELHEKAGDLVLGDEQQQKQLNSLVPGSEEHVIKPKLGKKAKKKLRQAERESTKGAGWFGMKAPELTEESRRDLEVLQMRNALDPKRFYKKNDLKDALPKFFQVGQVVDSPADYYSTRISKKERKKTLVDELMADAEFKNFSKRKYSEIVVEKSKMHRYQGKFKKRKAK